MLDFLTGFLVPDVFLASFWMSSVFLTVFCCATALPVFLLAPFSSSACLPSCVSVLNIFSNIGFILSGSGGGCGKKSCAWPSGRPPSPCQDDLSAPGWWRCSVASFQSVRGGCAPEGGGIGYTGCNITGLSCVEGVWRLLPDDDQGASLLVMLSVHHAALASLTAGIMLASACLSSCLMRACGLA